MVSCMYTMNCLSFYVRVLRDEAKQVSQLQTDTFSRSPPDYTRGNTSELGLFVYIAPSHGWDQNLLQHMLYTVLNAKTSDIEEDVCAYGPIAGGEGWPSSYIIGLTILVRLHRSERVIDKCVVFVADLSFAR